MSKEIESLQPQRLWKNFAALNEVPRPSKKEEKVIAFMQNYGQQLGLETTTDATGNVLIKKPATKGMENRKKVILQSHLDMVHQKNNDTDFDFDKEGIKMYIDGDWVKAKGTTLGADNGIGVASIMTILESSDIPHPALEALFTIDEETGMTGAFGLEPGFLHGEILLNLDTEDDNELTIGCAGGIDVNAEKEYEEVAIPKDYIVYKLAIKGLTGGHSGMDIILGRGNANKLMNRVLYQLAEEIPLGICEIHGGGLRNAIPRESIASIAIPKTSKDKFSSICEAFEKEVKIEHELTDPNFIFEISEGENASKMATVDFSKKITQAIYAAPNGIYRMSSTVQGMVQTSNNIAQVNMVNGQFLCLTLCRSSVDSEKLDEVRAIASAFAIIEAEFSSSGSYPGWTPRAQSDIVDIMEKIYKEKFKESPNVTACHAGLECGIIGSNYPDMDMVSFGPNIRGPHSPDEKVQISSVKKFWDYLLEILQQIPLED